MAEIRNLTRNGETFYPLTHEKAVIGMEDFKDTITEQIDNYRPIEITGDVVNAPDEEDITSDANNLLKFKNRNNLYGLGKIILRRGSSFASQVTQANTIYVIQYNFDLENGRVNIPNGSILLFEGGTLSNSTLVCADLYNVRLVYYQDQSEILSGVTLEGNFIHKACDKDTIRQILVDNSSITKDVNDVLSVKANGIQNTHLNSSVVDNSSTALDSNNKISIKDGGVTGAKLNSGVVNTDDLSIVNNKIQLANRTYNSVSPEGMGMIILRKDLSFASQLTQINTIYVIRYNYTLTSDVTIPANSILKFEGGSISGAYTITGNNTGINADLVQIFNTNITTAGSWNVAEAYPEWFGAVGDEVTDDTTAIQKTIDLNGQYHNLKIVLVDKQYKISSINLRRGKSLVGTYNKNGFDIIKGTTLLCISTTDPAVKMENGCLISNICFFYPNQVHTNIESIVEYPATISISQYGAYNTIRDISLVESFIGIESLLGHKNLVVENVVGFCYKYGIHIVASHDIDRITNVHFNVNYLTQSNYYNVLHPEIDTNVCLRYSRTYGTAFKIRRSDWCEITNCFNYGYYHGFLLGADMGEAAQTTAGYNFQVIGGGSDACNIGISIRYVAYATVSNFQIYQGSTLQDVPISGESIYIESGTGIHLDNINVQRHKSRALFVNAVNDFIISNSCFDGADIFSSAWPIYLSNSHGLTLSKCTFRNYQGIGVILFKTIIRLIDSVFDNCLQSLAVIEGTDAITDTKYIIESNTQFINCFKTAIKTLKNKVLYVGDSTKRSVVTTILNNSTYAGIIVDGFQYFDTDLGKPIYWDGTNWVDSTGQTV